MVILVLYLALDFHLSMEVMRTFISFSGVIFPNSITSFTFLFLGPFMFLDTYGTDKFVERMERLHEVVGGERFVPCQMLLDYAKDPSKKFHKR